MIEGGEYRKVGNKREGRRITEEKEER